jgi:hypothetical protein
MRAELGLAVLVLLSPALHAGPPGPAYRGGDTAAAIRAELEAAASAQSLSIDKCLGWIRRAYALADADPGGAEGFAALELVLEIEQRRSSAEIARAAEGVEERLLAGYADDLARIGPYIQRRGDLEFTRAVLERTKTPAVEATCLHAEVSAVLDEHWASDVPEAETARVLAIARRIQSEFGGVENASGVPFEEAVAGDVYQLEHLDIGMLAPEIEGEDLDGVRFKLSDYRGKVVVLDFWGNW